LKFPHPPQEEGVEMSTEMETAAATIGAEVTLCEEVPMVRRERWEEIRRLWVTERVSIAEIARRLDLDRKTVRRCVAAVSPPRAAGDAADAARRVSARAGGAGRLLGADPVSGAPAARLSRQLRDGQALRPAPARHALGGRARAHPVRDAARAAEPDRLGPCASAVPPRERRAAHLRAHARLQPTELLPALPQRGPAAVPGCARARVRVFRRPHAGASLRSAAHRLSRHGGGANPVELHVSELR